MTPAFQMRNGDRYCFVFFAALNAGYAPFVASVWLGLFFAICAGLWGFAAGLAWRSR